MDYATLTLLRQAHPAWRLLRSDHAPLVASFLNRVFIAPNVRLMAQSDLAEALEDELFALREQHGPDTFPRSALAYLNEWVDNDKGWLRKFYPAGSDEPHFDLTPATEKALALAGKPDRAGLCGDRVAAADPLRASAADERREPDRSQGPDCRAGEAA